MELTHTRLLVDNYKECFLFYRDVLGFDVKSGDENSAAADLQFNHCTVELAERSLIAPTPDSLVASSPLGTVIFEVENTEAAYERLRHSVKFITSPTVQGGQGGKVAHFRDPAGTLIELNEAIAG
ncbi:catechol 2,3-dioxygenase-like lactoylglutathione lyase family enzyme [Planomicrobium koreense]|uniref:Catechol 2,3-dioxygenase-like lactoylglutathione lyase family enzyme n=1 Tax=Planococcus koreensis TaxID=112331 RepID=A0A7W8CPF0_9BACL|nr:VOC family protein [Planococcus koreensis]MBB5179190.1 catechol 2,3-dioxygenase-like lactoylglutathione lyase family enzyme [Planococcus koreensis]